MVPIGYCDADWGSNKEDRHSVSGVVFMLAGCHSPGVSDQHHRSSCSHDKEASLCSIFLSLRLWSDWWYSLSLSWLSLRSFSLPAQAAPGQ